MKIESIKQMIEEFLSHLTVNYDEVDISDGWIGNKKFLIKSPDSSLLIGHKGENLLAMNYLIKKMVESRLKDDQKLNFYIDVNDYQENQINELVNKTKLLAERAKNFEMDVELPPMSSYERLIIHSVFSDDKDLETESSGVGSNRRIVLKYRKNS